MKLLKPVDAIIVGGGVIGASIFHRLTQAGLKTLLIEKNVIGHGATVYSGGIVRCYHSNSQLSDMAVDGYHYYKQFEENTGVPVPFNETGFVYINRLSEQKATQKEVNRLAQKVDMEWLDHQQSKAKFPYLKLSNNQGIVYEPAAGYMDTYETTKAWISAGERNGGLVIEGVSVDKLISANDEFIGVQTNIGPIYADRMIICAGAAIPSLLSKNKLDTDIYPQAIQVNRLYSNDFPDQHPAFIDDEYNLNGRSYNQHSMLAGYPTYDRDFTDEKLSVDLAHTELTSHFLEKRFDWSKKSCAEGGYKCFDSYTEEGLGEVKFSDDNNKVIVAGGFSGGAFKLAPAIAERVNNLLHP